MWDAASLFGFRTAKRREQSYGERACRPQEAPPPPPRPMKTSRHPTRSRYAAMRRGLIHESGVWWSRRLLDADRRAHSTTARTHTATSVVYGSLRAERDKESVAIPGAELQTRHEPSKDCACSVLQGRTRQLSKHRGGESRASTGREVAVKPPQA